MCKSSPTCSQLEWPHLLLPTLVRSCLLCLQNICARAYLIPRMHCETARLLMHIAVPRVHVCVCALVRCRLVAVTMQPAGHRGWPGMVRTSYAVFRVLHAEKKTGKLASYLLNKCMGQRGGRGNSQHQVSAERPPSATSFRYALHHTPPFTTTHDQLLGVHYTNPTPSAALL